MAKKLQAKQLATTFAVWSAFFMLVLWLLANMGIYFSAAEMMINWHMFFNLTFTGLVAGIVEAAIVSYVLALAFTWLYDWVGERS